MIVTRREAIFKHSFQLVRPESHLRGTDAVATRPWLPHETCRRSCDRVDDVTVTGSHVDAIDANLKFRKVRKRRRVRTMPIGFSIYLGEPMSVPWKTFARSLRLNV